MAESNVRQYGVHARSTDTFGRVLCNARNHDFLVDGPVENGCPGEELTPGELYLAGIASCGVELLQVLARDQQLPLESVSVRVQGVLDRDNPVRPDVSVFNSVHLQFELEGVTKEQGGQLIEAFKGR